eukprot:jgi/Psemu1/225415/e_gw1.1607.6.1
MTSNSINNDNNTTVLERSLGKLLGFEEGEAEDLLDHLFSIESEEDLSEYLVQLLGDPTPEVAAFVADVDSFRAAVALGTNKTTTTTTTTTTTMEKTNASAHRKQQGKKSRVPPPKKLPAASLSSSSSSSSSQQQPSAATGATKPQQVRRETANSTTNSTSTTATATATATTATATVPKKFHPTRGKAEIVCGCFGTRHKALTNCLYCGRISCEVEGYGFCPFCGLLVEAEGSNVGSNDKAYQQKERLLRFDRDFARRTEVFDDQADYQGPGTWMTEDEQHEAEENQQKHLDSLKRPGQQTHMVTIAM